jgi:hypothetical protein
LDTKLCDGRLGSKLDVKGGEGGEGMGGGGGGVQGKHSRVLILYILLHREDGRIIVSLLERSGCANGVDEFIVCW